jgi:hypothetical protein
VRVVVADGVSQQRPHSLHSTILHSTA